MLLIVAVKPLSRIVVGASAVLSVLAGCGGVTLQPTDGGRGGNTGAGATGGAGHGGGNGGSDGGAGREAGTVCSGLSLDQCMATSGCTAQNCPTCTTGQFTYSACYRSDESPAPVCIAPPCTPPPPACGTLDESTCKARSDCTPGYCQGCTGGQTFAGCTAQGMGVACPAILCASPCSGLGETACTSTSGCTPEYCPNCNGGQTFQGCAAPGGPGIACGVECVGTACSTVTTESACNARTDCHSVFVDPGTCGCAGVGCCAHFARCADGGTASCKGTPACQIVSPYCDAPAFVVSYTASCCEGCVRPTECGP